jgi:hypothetical protein
LWECSKPAGLHGRHGHRLERAVRGIQSTLGEFKYVEASSLSRFHSVDLAIYPRLSVAGSSRTGRALRRTFASFFDSLLPLRDRKTWRAHSRDRGPLPSSFPPEVVRQRTSRCRGCVPPGVPFGLLLLGCWHDVHRAFADAPVRARQQLRGVRFLAPGHQVFCVGS